MLYNIEPNFSSSRDHYFTIKSQKKRVLHIGACDSPYTTQKNSEGLLLHEKLNSVASFLLGIDIDKAAIQKMKDLGYENIIYFDLNELSEIKEKFDLIIFGETIEHVMNLEVTLNNLKNAMHDETELLISTPNSTYLTNFINALKLKEVTHPDHKFIFSYQTLKNLLIANNFHVQEIIFTFLDRKHHSLKKRIFMYLVNKYFNGIAETIVISCKLNVKC